MIATGPSEALALEEFLEWLPSARTAPDPGALLEDYRANLRRRGASAFETEDRLALVTAGMSGRSEAWRHMFNNIYAGLERADPPASPFLVHAAAGLAPGRALDVCAGDGRNALHLALRGWQVCGFDVAERGLQIARARGRRFGVPLAMLQCAEQDFAYGAGWDLIVFSFAPVPAADPSFAAKVKGALRPGGVVLLESFALDSRLGPTRIGALEVDAGALRRAFGDFRLEICETVDVSSSWDPEPAPIVRFLAAAP